MKHRVNLSAGRIFFVIFILAVVLDRIYWATISTWREDEATNLWLGYNAFKTGLSVGLISSKFVPNPNGMPLLGILFSRLPNLLVISSVLGCIQAFLIILFCRKAFSQRKGVWLVALPILTSIFVRASGIEFWNQFIFVSINLAFLLLIFLYLERSNYWYLTGVAFLILLSPSLYLAGIVNALLFTIVTFIAFIYKRVSPRYLKKGGNWIIPLLVVFIVATLFVKFTWIPYFKAVSLGELVAKTHTDIPAGERLWTAFLALITFVKWIFQWAVSTYHYFAYYSPEILPSYSLHLSKAVSYFLKVQAAILFVVIVLAVSRRNLARFDFRFFLVFLFLILSYMASPLLGGPHWHKGERIDQCIQMVPFHYFLIFSASYLLLPGIFRLKFFRIVIPAIAIAVSLANIANGIVIVSSHLNYRGSVFTGADVPLLHKMKAVDFIAKDWKKFSSSKIIPVDYDVGGIWEWVPHFGRNLEKYYPASMTTGRSFDFEFKRRYGLSNVQEGIQMRTVGKGKYVVSYAFNPPPDLKTENVSHVTFGRLRVTVNRDITSFLYQPYSRDIRKSP